MIFSTDEDGGEYFIPGIPASGGRPATPDEWIPSGYWQPDTPATPGTPAIPGRWVGQGHWRHGTPATPGNPGTEGSWVPYGKEKPQRMPIESTETGTTNPDTSQIDGDMDAVYFELPENSNLTPEELIKQLKWLIPAVDEKNVKILDDDDVEEIRALNIGDSLPTERDAPWNSGSTSTSNGQWIDGSSTPTYSSGGHHSEPTSTSNDQWIDGIDSPTAYSSNGQTIGAVYPTSSQDEWSSKGKFNSGIIRPSSTSGVRGYTSSG